MSHHYRLHWLQHKHKLTTGLNVFNRKMTMFLSCLRLSYLKCIIIIQILNDGIKYSGFSFSFTVAVIKNFQKSIPLEILLGSPTQTLCDGYRFYINCLNFKNYSNRDLLYGFN